jgi:AraC-like DNA-binding protein
MEENEVFGINTEHPHYTSDEVFLSPQMTVLGFVEESYNKKLHSQEFYEINIVLSGSANHYIGKRKITVSVGDTFIIPPSVMHGYDGGEGFDVYHVLLSPKYLEKYSASLQLLPAFSSLFKIDPLMREKTSARLHFRLSEEEIASLMPRLKCLNVHSYGSGHADPIISEGEALIIIAELCAIYENRAEELIAPESEDMAFLSSISHLYEHYSEKLTVYYLARIAHMSRTSYITKFKRVTGQSPARFIKLHRIDMAKRMLTETSMSEAEIAQEVGCVDVSHLIKMFYSEVGMTPSAYRKR